MEECLYGVDCYRESEAHLLKYKHPHLDELLPAYRINGSNLQLTVEQTTRLRVHTEEQRAKLLAQLAVLQRAPAAADIPQAPAAAGSLQSNEDLSVLQSKKKGGSSLQKKEDSRSLPLTSEPKRLRSSSNSINKNAKWEVCGQLFPCGLHKCEETGFTSHGDHTKCERRRKVALAGCGHSKTVACWQADKNIPECTQA